MRACWWGLPFWPVLYEHTCVQDILLPIFTYKRFQSIFATKNYIHAYPRYFCFQKLHICISKVFLLPKHYILCIFRVFLLPKITYMHIQGICYQKLHTHIFKYFCYLNYILCILMCHHFLLFLKPFLHHFNYWLVLIVKLIRQFYYLGSFS